MKSVIVLLLCFLLYCHNTYSQYSYCRGDNSPCSDTNLGNYTISGQKWDKYELNYYFKNGTDDISGDSEKDAFRVAFDKWSEAVPFVFTEVFIEAEANIIIIYADTEVFSQVMRGESAKIAAAYQPEQECRGHLFLNDDYHTFSLEANPSNAKDLYTVALHEMGHILGLCHSSNSSTVMYTEHSNNKRNLHAYDIDGIRAIYDVVKVKNEFLNKDGSYSSGGIVNVDGEDYDTEGLEDNEKVFVFPKSSTKTFRAKEQIIDDLYRRFNPFSNNAGGWRSGNFGTFLSSDSIYSTDILTDTYIARYRYKTTVGVNAQTEFNGNVNFPSTGVFSLMKLLFPFH